MPSYSKSLETVRLYQQIDTAVIDGESLPWVPFTPYSDDVLLKYFKLDPIRGEIIVLMKAPKSMQLPKHHSGTVVVYTLEGQWKYKEHDWVAGPGSVVFETAASCHTPEVVSTDDEGGYVVTLVSVMGDLVFVDENDNKRCIWNPTEALHSIPDARDLPTFGRRNRYSAVILPSLITFAQVASSWVTNLSRVGGSM
ncbi:2,4'-dihydroxyacetophenone dioxygenase family protein [Cupriavidus sp. IK-TO18]|uniref:2,4'-dihydroxyacetophenone dioxygenase family protein n=1 Tax=Cupriavidus sp. IK-TO18 TaxID=2782182 RepID=UPI00210502D5|nr:2,4'-dihydroxyacetophenone dioxygenase family protein [Cupriavidus sp. IK-TO18]